MSADPIPLPAPAQNLADLIGAAAPFAGLAPAILEAIADIAERRRYGAGQTVFALGQFDGEEFFLVVSGVIRVSVMDVATGSMVIEDTGAGGLFALDVAFAEPDAQTRDRLAVTAVEDLEIIAVDAGEFAAIAGQRPSLMRNLASFFAGELSRRRFRPAEIETPAERRILLALADHAARDPHGGGWRIARMPKHRELADQAGVEEAEAAGAVAALIQEGIARRDYPGLIIADIQRFNELAGLA